MSHSSMQESAPEDNNSEPGRGTSAGKCRAVTGPVWARLMDLEYANVGSNESQEEHTHLRSARHTSQGQHHTQHANNHTTTEHMNTWDGTPATPRTCSCLPRLCLVQRVQHSQTRCGSRPAHVPDGYLAGFVAGGDNELIPAPTNQPTNHPTNQPASQPAREPRAWT